MDDDGGGGGERPAPEKDDDWVAARRLSPEPRHEYTHPRGGGGRRGDDGWRGGRGGLERVAQDDGWRLGDKRPAAPFWERNRRRQQQRVRSSRPPEEILDLWCRVCNRGLQDKNSMAAHLKSKKHRQALEVARKEEEREEEENRAAMDDDGGEGGEGGTGDGAGRSHYLEKRLVTKEEKIKMLGEGAQAIEGTPKPFKEWANRSLLAAKALGDERRLQAVFREIVEELTVHRKNGTISYQDWKRRENASGDNYRKEEPVDVRIPLFNAAKRDPIVQPLYERAVGSTRGMGAAPRVSGGGTSAASAPSAPRNGLRAWFNPAARTEDEHGAVPAPAVEEIDVDDPLVARHIGYNSDKRLPADAHPVPATIPDSMALTGDHPRTSMTVVNAGANAAAEPLDLTLSGLPGYRAKPDVPDFKTVPMRRRGSHFRPRGSYARDVWAACRSAAADDKQLRLTAVLFDREYARSGGVVEGDAAGEGDNAAEIRVLRQHLRDLVNEKEGGQYSYSLFAPRVAALIDEMEAASRKYTPALMKAYELYVEVNVVQDQFAEAVAPCKQLMTIYRAIQTKEICPRIDEFRAYFVMLLLIEQRKMTSKELNKMGKFRNPRNSIDSPAVHLAHFLRPLRLPHGVMTRHALSVLCVVLNREYYLFFSLYKNSRGIEACDGRLQILMDGLADIVRSEALLCLHSVMDFPALYPLNDIMELLNWYNPDSKSCDVEEARSFVKRLGMLIVEAKSEEGIVPATGAGHIQVKCFDAREDPRRKLYPAYGVANRALFTTANASGSARGARR
jgi:hypothetical protein